jgi:hypothetical protein
MTALAVDDARPARKRRVIFRVLALFLVLMVMAAGLLFTELALRSSRSSSFYTEVRRHPPHPFLQAVPAMAAGNVNRYGFRGDDFQQAKPARTFRIFTLGGSTTLGVSNDYRDTYPFLLQTELRSRYPDVNIEVQNAGCAWYTSAHALVSYVTAVRQFDPDLVIFFEAINDIVRSFSPPWLASGPFKPDYSHYLGPYARMMGPQSEFFDPSGPFLTWSVVRAWARRDPNPFDIRSHENVARALSRLTQVDRPAFRSLPSFRRYSEGIIHAVQADGHPIMIASQPSIYRPDLEDDNRSRLWFAPLLCAEAGTCPSLGAMTFAMDSYNAAAREVAAKSGATFIDFAEAVPKTAEYFTDDVHLTKRANAILAARAAEAIVSAGLVEAAMHAPTPKGARR